VRAFDAFLLDKLEDVLCHLALKLRLRIGPQVAAVAAGGAACHAARVEHDARFAVALQLLEPVCRCAAGHASADHDDVGRARRRRQRRRERVGRQAVEPPRLRRLGARADERRRRGGSREHRRRRRRAA